MLEENALLEALRSGKIAGAGFDVYPKEPLPKDHPHLNLAALVIENFQS